MLKKTLLIATLIFTAASLFAAPTDEEVTATYEGVFAAYGAVFMTYMIQAQPDGATLELDSMDGSSILIMDRLSIADLFAIIDGSFDGETPENLIPFDTISGGFTATAEGDIHIDVELEGGPVTRLEMSVEDGILSLLRADGADYIHLAPQFVYEI